MTAPDIDVRPRCRPTPVNAGGAGGFALARLLLRLLDHLRQLDRKLLLLLAVSSLSACIIPVGPEFQDPLGVPNSPPQILDPDPTWGEEVTATPALLKDFSFDFIDVNADDELEIEWIVDGTRVSLSRVLSGSGGTAVKHTEVKRIACVEVDQATSRHVVIAGVADRPFSTNDPLAVTDNGLPAFVPWTLNLTCSQQ
jgi:hypothetical protein